MNKGTCSVDGCEKPAKTRGWCSTHYGRWIKYGDTADRPRPGRSVCSVEGCDRWVAADGFCHKHWYRWRNGLALEVPTIDLRRRPPKPCSVEGCEGRAVGRGLCRPHYQSDWQTRYRENNPDKVRAWGYKKYGLTAQDVADIIASQGGLCPICERVPERPHIDHNHDTGQVRGILCHNCNIGLGHFHDDYDRLIRAMSYLVSARP